MFISKIIFSFYIPWDLFRHKLLNIFININFRELFFQSFWISIWEVLEDLDNLILFTPVIIKLIQS